MTILLLIHVALSHLLALSCLVSHVAHMAQNVQPQLMLQQALLRDALRPHVIGSCYQRHAREHIPCCHFTGVHQLHYLTQVHLALVVQFCQVTLCGVGACCYVHF